MILDDRFGAKRDFFVCNKFECPYIDESLEPDDFDLFCFDHSCINYSSCDFCSNSFSPDICKDCIFYKYY